MSTRKFVLAAVAVIGVAAALPAQAFTYDSRTNQGGDASKFQDPDSQTKKLGDSHFSMQFSGGSSGQQQSGYDSRFVPSGNSAFGPGGGSNNLDTALGNRHW